MRRPRSERGTTLLEVVVATALLAGGLLSTASLLDGIRGADRAADRRAHAVELARNAVDELRSAPFDEVGLAADADGFTSTFDGLPTVEVTGSRFAPTEVVEDPVGAFTVSRHVTWESTELASGSVVPGAWKRITVVVSFDGNRQVRLDDGLAPVVNGPECETRWVDQAPEPLEGLVNTFVAGTEPAPAGSTVVSVGEPTPADTAPFAPGDLVLVIQMTGKPGGGAGLHEYAVATSFVAGGRLSVTGRGLDGGLMNAYGEDGQFQVVRIPTYRDVIVGSAIKGLPWDGSTGGVLALDVAGTLELRGPVVNDGTGLKEPRPEGFVVGPGRLLPGGGLGGVGGGLTLIRARSVTGGDLISADASGGGDGGTVAVTVETGGLGSVKVSARPDTGDARPGALLASGDVAGYDLGGAERSALGVDEWTGVGLGVGCLPAVQTLVETSTPQVPRASGATATYRVSIANADGRGTAEDLRLDDFLPAGFGLVSTDDVSLSGGATRSAPTDGEEGSTTPTWGTFSLPGGGRIELTFTASVDPGVALTTFQNEASTSYVALGAPWAAAFSGSSTTAEDVTLVAPPQRTRTLAAGQSHTCAIIESGQVRCWGRNNYGQLGDGTTATRTSPVTVAGISGAVALAAGYNHTCAVLENGSLWCWGRNSQGQLGNGTVSTTASTVPTQVVGAGTYLGVSGGSEHTCGVVTDRSLRCWGYNASGQLGNGTTTRSTTPLVVAGSVGIAEVTLGQSHTCALSAIGQVSCWGFNGGGQLGDGTITTATTPILVPGLTLVGSVAAGATHTCAARLDGSARCWGTGTDGQLGAGAAASQLSPVAVAGEPAATQVAAGAAHTCATTAAGTATCWGRNGNGQLGNGTTVTATSPVAVTGVTDAATIANGSAHTCSMSSTNLVRCWGLNTHGQLGDASTTQRTTAVAVANLDVPIVPVVLSSVDGGDGHNCGVAAAATVRCWGRNNYGQLGNGTLTNSSAPVAVSGLTNATRVAVGMGHSCALRSDSTVRCWGRNTYGQLGDATTTQRTSPVTVSGLSGVTAITAGYLHTCALRSDATVRCWGYNSSGQLGDGTATQRTTPVTVTGLTNVVAISAGMYHTCAVRSDGTVRCWGRNAYGQLGDGTTTNRTTSVAVSGLTGVSGVTGGQEFTCALLAAGGVRCWGLNTYGQLGNGTTTQQLTPATVTGITDATGLDAGFTHTCAIRAGATVSCWGRNNYGQLGDGTTTQRTTPSAVSPSVLGTPTSINAGYYHSCSTVADGTAKCWGRNSYGQLGDGTATNASAPRVVRQ